MKSKIINSFFLATCGILFWLITIDVSGKWVGKVDYNGTDVPLTYDFKTEGAKLTGNITTPYGESQISDGKVDKDVITFNTQLNGTTIPQTGKVYQDSIVMKMDYNGNEMTATLKRAKN
ncbi:hypothetical protein [Mucilaginibacter lacusdianchii]|uniref:hypothetical protein n=1 Tax=Mucilaginibacter lacusdianchii TaxID=2684211 RepID=UPI00131C33F8|nr:hypothetical protein [Mucilaginibacter sp. JXJ CY 39]